MSLSEFYTVKAGDKTPLSSFSPKGSDSLRLEKSQAKEQLIDLTSQITRLQKLLYAQHKHKILIILQGMDTSGKDSTVRNVFHGVDPHGIRAISFKKPSEKELDHDYLWRVHKHIPSKGQIIIFNRSHYEDLVTVRVQNLQPESVWEKRYKHIQDFEAMLADEGCTILKFFLHIDRDEQKKRLQSRLDEPHKHWKFEHADLEARELWDEYVEAYNDALKETSKPHAPWYVIPGNKKWFRNWLVASILIEQLSHSDIGLPPVDFDPSSINVH